MALIVLVNPPIPGKRPALTVPSLGLGYLAAALRRAGLAVKVVDAPTSGLDHDAVAAAVADLRPDIVGLTATTPLADSAFRLAASLRRHARWLVLGGAHASAVGRSIFAQCPELDYGFRGEAEGVFPGFARTLLAGGADSGLPGVISPARDAQSACVGDPDLLDSPAWDLMPMRGCRHPLFPGERVAPVLSSRGCPYRCIFCDKSVCGSRFRPRSPQSVLRELEALRDGEGVEAVIFYDDLFTLDGARVREICRLMVERGLRMRWKCEGRVNIVDDETLAWMKRAGCVQIAYGMETAHQKGLDWLRKGITTAQIREAVARTKKAGIQVLGYFVLGLPVEDYEEELETAAFAADLGLDYAQFGSLSPFPGTELHGLALEKGWYREGPGPAPEEYGATRPLIVTEYWTPQRLESIMREAYRRFYMRPGYLLRAALRPRGWLDLAKSGLRLARWLGGRSLL